MVIKIIKVPEGPEPEWVRKEWIGMWLAAQDRPDQDGIFIDGKQILTTLKQKSPKAAEYYFSVANEEEWNLFCFGPLAEDEYREV